MALFRVSNERAQFDAAGNDASDQYGAGIRFTQGGNARVTTGSPTNYNQGIPMSSTGQVAIVDATAGLPAGTIFHNGLPISADKVCVSRNATAVVSNGLPFDSAGAVAADVNLDLNFIGTDTLNSSVTFTRASTGTYFDSTGTLQSAAINAPRFDYNPSTLAAQGLLIEEARTNSIRNNTMQGAVAGTPGTLPTNWQQAGLGTLTREIVGVGTENGITYVDIRYSGTTSTTSLALLPEQLTQITAASGQTWTSTFFLKLQAGSTTNITSLGNQVRGYDSGGVIQESNSTAVSLTSSLTRFAYSYALANAASTRVVNALLFSFASGVAIDITLRIGLPQLEQGAFATSVIPTTTTALTRSADVASVNTLSPWFNSTAGTLFAEYSRFGAVNFQACAVLGEATFQNLITLGFGSGAPSNNNRFDVNASGSSQASITLLTNPALNTVAKTVGAYAANDFAGTANGAVPGTDTSGTVPAGIAVLSIGCNSALNGGFLNGYLRRITYYPRRLSNAELQAITA